MEKTFTANDYAAAEAIHAKRSFLWVPDTRTGEDIAEFAAIADRAFAAMKSIHGDYLDCKRDEIDELETIRFANDELIRNA